jgi:hypothetical protein
MTLNSAIWIHPLPVTALLLEPFGIDQRIDEIDHDHDGHDRAQNIIELHVASYFLAGDDVEYRDNKKADAAGDHQEIEHVDDAFTAGDRNPAADSNGNPATRPALA